MTPRHPNHAAMRLDSIPLARMLGQLGHVVAVSAPAAREPVLRIVAEPVGHYYEWTVDGRIVASNGVDGTEDECRAEAHAALRRARERGAL